MLLILNTFEFYLPKRTTYIMWHVHTTNVSVTASLSSVTSVRFMIGNSHKNFVTAKN